MKNLKKINWKRLLLDNWVLKLASLTIAFVLWFVVIIEEDPLEDKTFYGIKVNLINTEKLEELGRVYEVLDGTDTVRSVTVEAPRSILSKLEVGDIMAEADLNNISGMNTVEIDFYCSRYNNYITEIEGNTSNVKLSIEDKASKSINIRSNVIGEVAEGYMISKNGISLEHTRLQVEGPKSKVDQITRALVDVDVNGAITGFSMPLDVYLLDERGNKLIFDSVEQSVKTVNVSTKVLKVQEIPVEYIFTGEPADGYLLTGVVEGNPKTVSIAGSPDVLSKVDRIVVNNGLDIEGATNTVTFEVNLSDYLKSGVIFADEQYNGEALLTVYVEEEQEKNLVVRRENLEILNVPEGITAEVVIEQDIPALQVTGLAADLSSLRESTLTGTIDVAAWMLENNIEVLSSEILSLPVTFELEEGQNIENQVFVQVLFVDIVAETAAQAATESEEAIDQVQE